MANNGQAHLGTHPLTETTCDYQRCWCHQKARDHQYGPHSSGGGVNSRVGSLPRSYSDGSPDPLLYTQAQVDALVAAAKEGAAKMLEDAKELREHEVFRGLDTSGPDGWRPLKQSETSLLKSLAAKIREGK